MKTYDELIEDLKHYQAQLSRANNDVSNYITKRNNINSNDGIYWYNVEVTVKHKTRIFGFTASPYYTYENETRFNQDLYNQHILQADNLINIAREKISQTQKQVKEIQTNIDKLNSLITDGDDLYNQQKYIDAIEKYDDSIKYKVQPVISYTKKAAAYIELKEYEQAIESCNQALYLDENNVLAQQTLITIMNLQQTNNFVIEESSDPINNNTRITEDSQDYILTGESDDIVLPDVVIN